MRKKFETSTNSAENQGLAAFPASVRVTAPAELEMQPVLLSLLNNLPGMVYRGLPDWSVVFACAEVERLTGYSAEEITFGAIPWRRLIHPDDFASVRESVRFAVRRREPILRMEYRIERKDGEIRWVSDRRQMIYREDGRLLHVDGLILDMTEQKKVELDLRAAFERAEGERRRTEAIIAGIGEGISIQTVDRTIVYQNQVLKDMIGNRERTDCHKFHGCLQGGRASCPVSSTFEDGRVRTAEAEAITDRGLVQLEITASPLRDSRGKVTDVISIVRDITERKRAEEERRRLATAVEQAADAILVTDADWVIRYANPAFEKVTGYGKEEVLGRNPYVLSAENRDEQLYLAIAGKVRSGESWKGRMTNRGKGGAILAQDTTISPVRDAAGKIVNYVIAKRDITREVVLEKQVQAAQRMEAVGNLAGGIAHDFNNALTGILGFAELLRLRFSGEPKTRGDVDEIIKCAERASTLTRQLLAFARRQVIEPVKLDMNAVARDLAKLMKKVAGEHVDVRMKLAEGIPAILADRGQMEQVLMNLCLNSRDAMPRGGEFLVSTEAVVRREPTGRQRSGLMEAAMAHPPPGAYVLMKVSDTGCGMDEQTRENAFEPYFTTKPPGKGTGLGLSMVYGIVKQNQGYVFLDSRPGEGTACRLYFPALEEAADRREEEKAAPVKGGAETILLAEDEGAIRSLAERALSAFGYTVLTARDGMEAVAISMEHPEISLALLDVIMPRMGGKEALDEIRKVRPGLPALFTSGYSTDQIHESFVLLPGIEFLPKPYGPSILGRRVREVLDGVRHRSDPSPPPS